MAIEATRSISFQEKQLAFIHEANTLANTVMCPLLSQVLPHEAQVACISLDMGSSHIKATCTTDDGTIIGNWVLSSSDSFLPGGFVNLQRYATSAFAVLSSIAHSGLDFSSLRTIATDGIIPSTVVIEGGKTFLDNFGFSYAADKLGTKSAHYYTSTTGNSNTQKKRGVLPASASAAEAIRELINTDFISNKGFKVTDLTDFVIQFLMDGEGRMPFHVLQYMGLLMHDGAFFDPQVVSSENTFSVNPPEEYKIGYADNKILHLLGFTVQNDVEIYNRGLDGLAIQRIMDLAEERDLGKVVARAKAETTLAVHTHVQSLTDKPFGGWILRDGPGWKVGIASNDSAGRYKEVTWNQGYESLPLGDSLPIYRSFFQKRKDETDTQYFTRLDDETNLWIKTHQTEFAGMVNDAGVWLFGPDRNGNGPSQAKLTKSNYPKDPRAFWYLLKESSALSMRRMLNQVEDYTENPIDALLLLGPLVNSPFWRFLHTTITGRKGFMVTHNGEVAQEPSLISLALSALESQGNTRAAQILMDSVGFQEVETSNMEMFKGIDINSRYKEYCREYQ
ncbi:MAG: hypothetical protein WC489_03355 [Patescibacteria group bacterium]